jgi:membrane protease YdiL (CAAX protease family)
VPEGRAGVGARLRAVLLAYAAGLALTIFTTTGFVFLVARAGAGSGVTDPTEAVTEFARSPAGLSWCALIEGLVLLAVAVTASRLEGGADRMGLRMGRSGAPRSAWLAAMVGLLGVTMAGAGAGELAGARGVINMAAGAFHHSRAAPLAAMVVAVGVFPAAGEEALFRGYIQPRLASVLGRWPAIVATSLAFGVFHGDVAQGAAAFAAGLFLGWTADRMGSLQPVIAAHATNNAVFVLSSAAGLTLPPVAEITAGLLACAGACVALARSRPRPRDSRVDSEHRYALHE